MKFTKKRVSGVNLFSTTGLALDLGLRLLSVVQGNFRMKAIFAMAGVAVIVSGCAKNADQIAASYVSPYQYETFTCPQIADEAQRVSARAAALAGAQDSKATKDAVVTTVGLIVFWPALFALGGNDQQTGELARLRGEMEALEQVAVRKRCGIQFQRSAPPPANEKVQAAPRT